jgi:hypothetical protein
VNASRLPSRASRASLGADAVRYSFTVTDFHRLPFAGLPAHPSTTSSADPAPALRAISAPPRPTSSAHLPEQGKGAGLILPACNTEAMNLHLVAIAAAVAPGARAVLPADQAGCHISRRLVVPPNITIIALPPKCPELNPMENVWQFMRNNWLSNRVFKSYDDLIDRCCEAWNELTDQPWRIMLSDCDGRPTGSDRRERA